MYSGAIVLVDTNTSTGIHYNYIEMMTLYSGVFVLIDTNTNTGIQYTVGIQSCCLLYVKLPPRAPDKSGDIRITYVLRRQRELPSAISHQGGMNQKYVMYCSYIIKGS